MGLVQGALALRQVEEQPAEALALARAREHWGVRQVLTQQRIRQRD